MPRNFSDRVRALRKRLQISQESLARLLNVSFATVNRWEQGHHQPQGVPLAAFERLASRGKAPKRQMVKKIRHRGLGRSTIL